MAIVLSRIRSIFRVAHPPSVPRTLHLFLDALAFVFSTSAREQPSSSLIRVWFGRGCVASSLFPESRTARTKAATSRAMLHQPVPSKLFTTVVLSVSHSEKNFLHHRRLTRSITIRHFHRAGHVFPYNFTFTVFDVESQFASRSCGDSIIFFASVDHAFVLMKSD